MKFQGYFFRFCNTEQTRLASIFSGVDFKFATKFNLTDPADWLLYDTGFVLKMNKNLSTHYDEQMSLVRESRERKKDLRKLN